MALVALAADWGRLRQQFLQIDIAREQFPEIITIAAKNTLLFTVVAFIGGLILGIVLALMKLSTIGPYRWLATGYIELFRGLPALLTIFAMAYVLPIALEIRVPFGQVGAGLVGLILVAGAYMAETIRAGIQGVPKGQAEAARSLGMSPSWTMVSVILPQAFRIIVPPLTNEFVLLIKDTSLLFIAGSTIQTKELTTFTRDAQSVYFNGTPLLMAAMLYLFITIPLTRLVAVLERRMARSR
nr:amino acid ABC transporter permease [Phytoactinopolyspora halotolerans]